MSNSRAWSIGKTDRCKYNFDLILFHRMHYLNITFIYIIVKMTAEKKKNIFLQNVSPNSYETTGNKNKKSEP